MIFMLMPPLLPLRCCCCALRRRRRRSLTPRYGRRYLMIIYAATPCFRIRRYVALYRHATYAADAADAAVASALPLPRQSRVASFMPPLR